LTVIDAELTPRHQGHDGDGQGHRPYGLAVQENVEQRRPPWPLFSSFGLPILDLAGS
jgi:hypothetical protein